MSQEDCIFCKIIKKEIPSDIILETDLSLAFTDINPLSKGHVLIIPKEHAEKMHEHTDEALSDILSVIKRIVNASPIKDYNILQNNGRIAHQLIMHTHFHLIPKPSKDRGLVIGWSTRDDEDQKSFAESVRKNL